MIGTQELGQAACRACLEMETGRVHLGGCPPKPPTDPDVPVKEASGSSCRGFVVPRTISGLAVTR